MIIVHGYPNDNRLRIELFLIFSDQVRLGLGFL